MLITGLVGVPIFAVAYLALTPEENIWPHLVSTVLPGYIGTTLTLMAGVGAGTLLIGVGTAWMVTMLRFPGRRFFEWGMLLPMAMPAYVIAYVYTDIFEYSGPLQAMLRDMFGWSSKRDYWFPEIRSVGGAISMMTLVLYPYVYLLARAAFLEQSIGVLEASRSLGRGPWRSFFTVALPLARPAMDTACLTLPIVRPAPVPTALAIFSTRTDRLGSDAMTSPTLPRLASGARISRRARITTAGNDGRS